MGVVESFSVDGVGVYLFERPVLAEPSFLVLGLPDAGLVGAIAAKYASVRLNMRLVGEIDASGVLPPLSVVHRGVPLSPFQLYVNNSGRMVVLVSEAPLPAAAVYPVSRAVVELASRLGFSYIVSLSGIAVPNRMEIKRPRVFWVSSTSGAGRVMEELGLKRFDEGFIVGPYAVILKEARRRGLDNIVILVESFLQFPDPESSAEALRVLSRLTGIEIDVGKLLEEAEMLKIQARELMKQTTKSMAEMQKRYEMHMPMMYI